MPAAPAPAPPPPRPPLYPAYCFPASPTYNAWAKLSTRALLALHTHPEFSSQNIYFHGNHPIRFVTLVGVLVAAEEFARRWVLALDDSSGAVVDVVVPKEGKACRLPPGIDAAHLAVGKVVKAKGTVSAFRGARQLELKRLSVISDTAEEARAWDAQRAFLVGVLGSPWVLGEAEMRELRAEALGLSALPEPVARGRSGGVLVVAEKEKQKERDKERESQAARGKRRQERACRLEMAKRMARGQFDVLGI